MFGSDDSGNDAGGGMEQPQGGGLKEKLLQKLIELLTDMPDKEEAAEPKEGGALEIAIGQPQEGPKKGLG